MYRNVYYIYAYMLHLRLISDYTQLQVFSEHSHMSILIMFLTNSDKPQTHVSEFPECNCDQSDQTDQGIRIIIEYDYSIY